MRKAINFNHSNEQIKKQLKKLHAYDIAKLYPYLEDDDKEKLVSLLTLEQKEKLFIELNLDLQVDFLDLLDLKTKKQLLNTLNTDDLKTFIEQLEDDENDQYLDLLENKKKHLIEKLLIYQDDVAAAIMNTNLISINQNMSIKEATHTVIQSADENHDMDVLFVVDDNNHYVGTVDLKSLIVARPHNVLSEIIDYQESYVYEYEPISQTIQKLKDYDLKVMGVLNEDNGLIGMITADDIFDEISETFDSQLDKIASLGDYQDYSTAFERVKMRFPWLLFSVILNLLMAVFLSVFELTLIEVAALVLFQPLILAMAGNIGTQSLAVTILGLHHQKIQGDNKKKHVKKELSIGLVNSIILGIIAFGFVYLFLNISPMGTQKPLHMGLLVAFSLATSMIASTFSGVFLPLLFDRINVDPGSASGPMMTTINDLVALVIYFGTATLIFVL
ncbi:MAG: magnesium transporter [Acholeplasmataceae bacterium]